VERQSRELAIQLNCVFIYDSYLYVILFHCLFIDSGSKLRSGRIINPDTPRPKKNVPVEKRCYKTNDIAPGTTSLSVVGYLKVKLNSSHEIVRAERLGRVPIEQKDLTTWTFFDEDRKECMKHSAAQGKGQSFWTEKERRVFQSFFLSSIKSGTQISTKRVNPFIDDQLKFTYPYFMKSFDDPKIRKSIYLLINYLAKKRLTNFGKLKRTDDLGVNSIPLMYTVEGVKYGCCL
jgi:hypothetical protein